MQARRKRKDRAWLATEKEKERSDVACQREGKGKMKLGLSRRMKRKDRAWFATEKAGKGKT